jgi:hypothetical protein
MQTFLPMPEFYGSARCLDDKRLGKQRVEAKQILIALGVPVGDHLGNSLSSWRHHPAVLMWKGHEADLAQYAMVMSDVWRMRGFKDTLFDQFRTAMRYCVNDCRFGMTSPNWLGFDRLHASHRSNLLRKDPRHYGRFGWKEPPDLPYFWPRTKETDLCQLPTDTPVPAQVAKT